MSSSKIKDGLPGFLPLYNGMPIVLKSKNISTDLGITNGCQGYLRHFDIDRTSTNICYCTCAFVEFPNSKVHLPDLPVTYFPIIPIKTTFITYLLNETGEKLKVNITRTQLPIQPAFAVTGHSAEGKTLPNVLTNLHEGGFGAYVAASRAQSRDGLFITETVNLADLNNKPIPYNLLQESKRLQILEHNTYVRYGFRDEKFQPIFDPESERNITHTNLIAHFDTSQAKQQKKEKSNTTISKPSTITNSPNLKRKHANSVDTSTTTPKKKHQQKSASTLFSDQTLTPISGGCTWNNENWSCAYDSVIMSLFYAFLSFDDITKTDWYQQNNLTNKLAILFQQLITSESDGNIMSSTSFNYIRDQLRDYLSNHDAHHFPRYGPLGAPVDRIFDYLKMSETTTLSLYQFCSSIIPCSSAVIIPLNEYIPPIFYTTLWNTYSGSTPSPNIATTQEWIDLAFQAKAMNYNQCLILHSSNCETLSNTSHICMNNTPPFLTFEIMPNTIPVHIPNKSIRIRSSTIDKTNTYTLRAIIYHGQYHFTVRLFDKNNNIWIYDGQKNEGFPTFDSSLQNHTNLHFLTSLDERSANTYLYSLSI